MFRLAIEKAPPAGTRLHANAEEGVPFREIAALIGRKLGLPVASRPPEHFGWFAHFAQIDNPCSNAKTRALLGWSPQQPGLLADREKNYF